MQAALTAALSQAQNLPGPFRRPTPLRPEMSAFQRTAERLLFASGGSRVTIRLDLADENFPVVAEAVTHGARHIKGDTVIGDLRRVATVQHLEQTHEILV